MRSPLRSTFRILTLGFPLMGLSCGIFVALYAPLWAALVPVMPPVVLGITLVSRRRAFEEYSAATLGFGVAALALLPFWLLCSLGSSLYAYGSPLALPWFLAVTLVLTVLHGRSQYQAYAKAFASARSQKSSRRALDLEQGLYYIQEAGPAPSLKHRRVYTWLAYGLPLLLTAPMAWPLLYVPHPVKQWPDARLFLCWFLGMPLYTALLSLLAQALARFQEIRQIGQSLGRPLRNAFAE